MSALVSAETPLWVTISGIVFGSGVGVTVITKYHDWLAKKREETLDMAKYRMNRVEKRFNDYIDLMNYANEVSAFTNRFSGTNQINSAKLFLSLLRFSEVHEKLVTKGDLLLTDQEAESVVVDLSHTLAKKIHDIFEREEDYWGFRELDSTKSLPNILKEIRNPIGIYTYYYKIIVSWFSIQSDQTKKIIELVSSSIDQVLLFEMNIVFEKWYPNKFVPDTFLSKEVSEYVLRIHEFSKGKLSTAYPRYYKKIFSY